MAKKTLCQDIQNIYTCALQAVRPDTLIRNGLIYYPDNDVLAVKGRTYKLNKNVSIVGFGKAVLGMATELYRMVGHHVIRGVLSVPVGALSHSIDSTIFSGNNIIKVYEAAANNLPDESSERTSRKILEIVESAGESELVIALVSGGGSALLSLPCEGVSIQEKRKAVELFSQTGATIKELNLLRQCLSRVKAGKLAAKVFPAQMLSLILSDVIDNPLQFIASGPTIAQSLDIKLLQTIIEKYSPKLKEPLPSPVSAALESAIQIGSVSCPSVDKCIQNVLIGSNTMAIEAASAAAKYCGYDVIVLSQTVQGEAKEVGRGYANLAGLLLDMMRNIVTISMWDLMQMFEPFFSLDENLFPFVQNISPHTCKNVCVISGGEPTVTVSGSGIGGRNQEMALAFAKHLSEMDTSCNTSSDIVFASIATDGQDGPTDAAGAFVFGDSWSKAIKDGLNPDISLANNDSHTFFHNFNSGRNLITTGITGTNVMDLHILLLMHKH